MIALGRTAELSRKSPAELLGILDPAIAFAFDLEVALALDDERIREKEIVENRQMEILAAAAGVSITNSLGQQLAGVE